jgi:hypothetical protein
MKRKAENVPETSPRPTVQVEKPKIRPPPIYTSRDVSAELAHIMTLMEAWSWLRTFPHSIKVVYVRIFPERLGAFHQLGVMSLIHRENPHGIYIMSNLDYFNHYLNITTTMRRPSPIDYYKAMEYFRLHNASMSLDDEFEFSSDDDDDY